MRAVTRVDADVTINKMAIDMEPKTSTVKRYPQYHISGDEGRMATPYGHIAAFHPESDSIKAYLERVQLYFAANKVPEDLQVPVLLSSIGAPTYSLLSDLFAPAAPGSKSLLDISAALHRHFEPSVFIFTNAIRQQAKALPTTTRT